MILPFPRPRRMPTPSSIDWDKLIGEKEGPARLGVLSRDSRHVHRQTTILSNGFFVKFRWIVEVLAEPGKLPTRINNLVSLRIHLLIISGERSTGKRRRHIRFYF